MTVATAVLAERVNGLRGSANHGYFVSSGSEANEAGFRFARQYMKREHAGEVRSPSPFVH